MSTFKPLTLEEARAIAAPTALWTSQVGPYRIQIDFHPLQGKAAFLGGYYEVYIQRVGLHGPLFIATGVLAAAILSNMETREEIEAAMAYDKREHASTCRVEEDGERVCTCGAVRDDAMRRLLRRPTPNIERVLQLRGD